MPAGVTGRRGHGRVALHTSLAEAALVVGPQFFLLRRDSRAYILVPGFSGPVGYRTKYQCRRAVLELRHHLTIYECAVKGLGRIGAEQTVIHSAARSIQGTRAMRLRGVIALIDGYLLSQLTSV